MDSISQYINLLRQEITDLRTLNTRYSEHAEHSPVEKSAFELRQNRLSQIKQELLNMRNSPPDLSVWWDKRPSGVRA